MWLALLGLLASLTLQQIRTFDYFWHLRTGELIADQGAVPKADPYTYTVSGARWVDIHWLFQLAVHGVYTLGGHAAVVMAKFATVLLLCGVLARIGYRRERAVVSGLALVLMLLIASDRFMPRPELPSFALLAGVLALLDRFERTGDRHVYWIVALQIIWVNVHGLFALGIALCAIHLAGAVSRPLLIPSASIDTKRLWRLATVTALAVLGSLLNPNGLDGALYPIEQLGMIGAPEQRGFFGSLVAELIPPLSGDKSLHPLVLGLTLLLVLLSAGAMSLNWRKLAVPDVLAWVAFGYLALSARRNLALFAIVAMPIWVRNANAVLDGRKFRPTLALWGTVAVAVVTGWVAIDVSRGTPQDRLGGGARERGFGLFEPIYAIGAVDWIEEHRPPGPICHHMAMGGYLIWRLFPDYPVMADGRLEVFGEEKFRSLQVTGPEAFRRLDLEYKFGVVLVQFSILDSEQLLRWLYLNSNWRLTFVDDAAAVFVRVRAGDPPGLVDLDIDSDELFEPFSDVGVADVIHRSARTNFYSALHRYELALEIWKETVGLYPDLPQGPVIHAALLRRNGFDAAAETILRRLLAERPRDAAVHAQIADLRRESGDVEAAEALYLRAVELDPGLTYALYHLGAIAEAKGDPTEAMRFYARVLHATLPNHPLAVAARGRLATLEAGRL
jgi:hypothetical protein